MRINNTHAFQGAATAPYAPGRQNDRLRGFDGIDGDVHAARGNARGIVRRIEDDSFKGSDVARLRLSINFREQVQAVREQRVQDQAPDTVAGYVDDITAQVNLALEDVALTDEQRAAADQALADFAAAADDAVAAFTSDQGDAAGNRDVLFEALRSAYGNLSATMRDILPPAETDDSSAGAIVAGSPEQKVTPPQVEAPGPVTEPIADSITDSAIETPPVEADVPATQTQSADAPVDESPAATDAIGDEPADTDPYAAFFETLAAIGDTALGDLEDSIDQLAQPHTFSSEGTSRGGAYAKFLAIYERLSQNADPTDDQASFDVDG